MFSAAHCWVGTGRAEAWTDKLWVYNLRTNMHFTLKQSPIQRKDFNEFVECYKPGRMHERTPTWSEQNPDGRWPGRQR